MSDIYLGVKWIGALLLSFWMGLTEAVQILIFLMGVDFATGLICGFVRKELDSAISYRGIAKKSLTLILIGVVHLVSKPLNLGIDIGTGIALAYIVNEVISIVENCARVGVYVPSPLLNALAKLRTTTQMNPEESSAYLEQFKK